MSENSSPASANQKCPNCGAQVAQLIPLDTGLKLSLSKSGSGANFDAACSNCINQLRGSASMGAQMVAKEQAKVEQKSELWRSRLNLVKQGRGCLSRNDYADAAVAYEKYLKLLTLVLGVEKKELKPDMFSKTPREVTIICSVLWDLMLVYDGIAQFHIKQRECAEMLAKFLRFTPIYNTVIRKAELEMRRAKNPQAFQHLLKLCDVQASRCFIANSVFQTRTDPSVQILCQFRDHVLKQSHWGRHFVAWYYRSSPKWARWIESRDWVRPLLARPLRGVAFVLQRTFHLPPRSDS